MCMFRSETHLSHTFQEANIYIGTSKFVRLVFVLHFLYLMHFKALILALSFVWPLSDRHDLFWLSSIVLEVWCPVLMISFFNKHNCSISFRNVVVVGEYTLSISGKKSLVPMILEHVRVFTQGYLSKSLN